MNLPKPVWVSVTPASAYVKGFLFFIMDQGGLRPGWGTHWHIVFALGKDDAERYEDAREFGYWLRKRRYGKEPAWELGVPSLTCIVLTYTVGWALEKVLRLGSRVNERLEAYR